MGSRKPRESSATSQIVGGLHRWLFTRCEIATSSPRGLDDWVYGFVVYRVVSEVSDQGKLVVVLKGLLREIVVGGKFRIRIKRHFKESRVETYPDPS